MFSAPSDTVLSSSFRYAHRRFLWARMRLFEDRIEFVGLGWRGVHRRTLSLDRVRDLRWWTGESTSNFALLVADEEKGGEGERLYVNVEAAGLWKHEVQARATNLHPEEAALPKVAPKSSRARAA